MDLTRTLQVKIDPGGAVAGGNAAANAFKSVGTAAGAMDKNVRGANDSLGKLGGGAGSGGLGGATGDPAPATSASVTSTASTTTGWTPR